jgi:formylmethanofuran dehydrogenase subunit D
MTGGNDAALMGLDAKAWSVVGDKGGASNYPGLNKTGDLRLYYHANGCNTVTVTSLTGAIIKSITITFTGSDYSNVAVTAGGNKINGEEGVYKINNTSFVLSNANTTNVQVRITGVLIDYTTEGGDLKTLTSVELSGDYLTRFTTGKDGDETPLPTATVKVGSENLVGAEAKWSLKMGDNWVMGEEEPSIGNGMVYIPSGSHGNLVLSAKYAGDDTYESSSKSYTLKVYKGYLNIQDVLEQYPTVGGDSWVTKEAAWTKGYQASYWQVDMPEGGEPKGKEALVTYANGTYTYIKDDYGTLLLYGSNLGFKQGDIISGDLGEGKIGAIYGTLKAYNGLLEMAVNKEDVEFVVKSSGNAVEPKTIVLSELNQTNMNEYLRIEKAVFVEANNKNLTFKVGEETLPVYNQWSIDVTTLEPGVEYTLEGMGCIYYKSGALTNQLYLTSFASVKPAATVELAEGYQTRFTTGKDGDEAPLPAATVKGGDAVIEGATVTWSLKMGDNWAMGEEEPSIGDGKVYIPQHSYGDLILTARYAGDATYEAGSKSYTLKVYKGYMNIQDVLEQFPEVGSDTWAGKEAAWTKGYQASYWQVDMPEGGQPKGKEALVTYVNGSYTYIRDDSGALLIYGGGLGFKKGDIITGDLGDDKGYGGIYGTLKSYNGLLELVVAKADVEFVVKSSGNTVEPKTISVDELNQSNVSEFLRIERAVFVGADKQNQKKLTFMVDKKEFLVFNQWGVNVAGLKEGAEYTLEGMGSIEYKNGELSNRLNLISFAESVNAPRIKSFKLTINHDGNVFTESFPASEWQNIVIEGQTSYLNIKKIEVEVGIPMQYVGFIGTLYNAEDGWQHDDTAWYTVNLEKQNDGLWTLEPEGGIDLTPPEVDGAGGSKPLTYEFFIYAEDENGTPLHYNNDGKNYKVTFTPADDPLAIGKVNSQPSTLNSQLYNTSGQPVTRTYRGVVIQNARKVLR